MSGQDTARAPRGSGDANVSPETAPGPAAGIVPTPDDTPARRADPDAAASARPEADAKGAARPDPDANGALRSGVPHLVALVRTTLYRVCATVYFLVVTTLCLWVLLMPPKVVRWIFNAWARSDMWLLRVLGGQRVEVLGRENIPHGAALVASKHQAAWETLALLPLLPAGSIIMKKELMRIPIYGWYARHFGMIPVDRSAGVSALKQLAEDASMVLAEGRQVVIFPEGTRRPVGAAPDYKPGAFFLYERLGVPMVPVALNSGLLWPRKRYVRYPGTITVSFLPAIPPGIDRKTARARLITAIEEESDRLANRTACGQASAARRH